MASMHRALNRLLSSSTLLADHCNNDIRCVFLLVFPQTTMVDKEDFRGNNNSLHTVIDSSSDKALRSKLS